MKEYFTLSVESGWPYRLCIIGQLLCFEGRNIDRQLFAQIFLEIIRCTTASALRSTWRFKFRRRQLPWLVRGYHSCLRGCCHGRHGWRFCICGRKRWICKDPFAEYQSSCSYSQVLNDLRPAGSIRSCLTLTMHCLGLDLWCTIVFVVM